MIHIHGVGHFHPENEIDNRFLEELDIGTTDEWIMERVGIQSRRTVLDLDYIRKTYNKNPAMAQEASLYSNAQTGARAAQNALERAGLNSEDIGLVISGSCTPQYSCPAEACTIAKELGIEVPAYDVNSACSSMASQLNLINMMKPEALPDYVLLAQTENSTRHIDYGDRSSCVLWGDCSSTMVVSTRIPAPLRIEHTTFTSSPQGAKKVQFIEHAHFTQDGRTVQTFAIKRSLAIIRELKSFVEDTKQTQIRFIGHQANLSMLQSVCKRADIAQVNHFYNVDQFGNCGAAGAPSVLSQNWDAFQVGDKVIVGVVGGGLSWGGALIDVTE